MDWKIAVPVLVALGGLVAFIAYNHHEEYAATYKPFMAIAYMIAVGIMIWDAALVVAQLSVKSYIPAATRHEGLSAIQEWSSDSGVGPVFVAIGGFLLVARQISRTIHKKDAQHPKG